MSYLVGGALLLLMGLLAMQAYAKAKPATLAKSVRWIAAGGLGLLALFLLIRGLTGPAMMVAGGALLPLIRNWHRLGGFARAMGGGGGQASQVRTAWLDMNLDHDSGTLDGTVLKGGHAGRRLGELTQPELLTLYEDLLAEDGEGARLLEAYLERVHPGWRGEGGGGQDTPAGSATMTEDEAWDVLGLQPGASRADILAAYKALMLKLHPDRGGSDYLAARVNQARAILLGD